jgi:hypothetical protein
MNYNFYLIATILLIIVPLIVTVIPKYILYINILAILFIFYGYLNINKYIFLFILCVLLFRYIFMDKNNDKNKKGVVEYFDNDVDDMSEQEDFKENGYIDETGIEDFLIKDKFSQLHDIIHEYQNALEKNKSELQNNGKIE